MQGQIPTVKRGRVVQSLTVSTYSCLKVLTSSAIAAPAECLHAPRPARLYYRDSKGAAPTGSCPVGRQRRGRYSRRTRPGHPHIDLQAGVVPNMHCTGELGVPTEISKSGKLG